MVRVVRTASILDLPSGVSLESVHSAPAPAPSSLDGGRKLAVCLHPWSWLGGNMDDFVLQSVEIPFIDAGYDVVRFNSRGVGKSKGWASFTGLREAEDLRSVVQWALREVPNVQTLVILGYSHGSLIASLHPVLPPPIKTYHILLSYPLGPRGPLTLFHSKTYASTLDSLLHNPASNVLVVFGDNDEFTASEKYDAWVEGLENETQGGGRGRLTVQKVPGATHFWSGEAGVTMRRAILEWLPT